MSKLPATAAEKRHLDRVASLSCAMCGARPVEVHHVRTGQGAGQRASHWLAVALCQDCHRGDQGLHGDRTMLRIQKVEELDLLARTIEGVMRERGD